MTENEYTRLKLSADATAARSLMLWAGRLLHAALPLEDNLRSQTLLVFQQKLSTLLKDQEELTFPEMHSAESDLWAAELQSSFERLSGEFYSCLTSGKLAE